MAQKHLLKNNQNTIKNSFKKRYSTLTAFIKRRPLGSFFIALGLLFFVIIVGHILNQPKVQKTPPAPPKTVQLYSIGQAPKATFQAKIEKAGVIKIMAQTSGIVQSVSVTDGSQIKKGQQILSLSSNYQGGNALALQSQVAQAQYQNVLDTYGQSEDEITQQRNIAQQTFSNYLSQQTIASASANDTSTLINNNQTVLDYLNQQLINAQNSGASESAIISQQSEINSLQGAQNSLRSSGDTLNQEINSTNPPGQIASSQQQLTLDQLNVQEKSLELNKEVTGLQAQLAEVNADTMLPASPVDGVVERVFVYPGQQVSSGTELAVISSDENSSQTIAVVDVPAQIAQSVSIVEPSILTIGNNTYQIRPFYVSTDATDGLLYSIFYTIPTAATNLVTDGQYTNIAIPIGSSKTEAAIPFVPIDAVYQTQDSNYLLVDEDNKAVSRKISLGDVFGSYVEVTNGLELGDQVILDRNILAGDKVTTN
jgi:multidrug efflux pump subunit AcrA (membrane-fusion protein)